VQIYGALAPAKTPVNIVERLNQETARVISRQEVKDRLLAAGLETVGGSPQAYASTIKSDLAKWAKLIKDVGIREE
jgi:tripartite-type tricarboxylate transporter receptor subunit TctC